MIVVTGAAGFIGSCLVRRLNDANFNRIVVVDKFDDTRKQPNLDGKVIEKRVDRDQFFPWLDSAYENVEFIFHLGARTDTAESDRHFLEEINTRYSKEIWKRCCSYQIPLVYASSAATYGNGSHGYLDRDNHIPLLEPLNAYGWSKNEFDKWAIKEANQPFFWAGLKFFNVYGPNEYHKDRMASVVFHAYNQIKHSKSMKLFRSHRPEYKNGEQQRDFIYVKDVVEVMFWLMHHRRNSGIYNLGSGKARSFLDLTRSVFDVLGYSEQITFIDTPKDIRENYQYFTEANMQKLQSIGYDQPFHSLEMGVKDYLTNFLDRKEPENRYF